MESKSWKPIKDFLKNLEQLTPIDTEVQERISPDPEIKAIIFDIYGTLLISDSGDIDMARFSSENLLYALQKADIQILEKEEQVKTRFLEDMLQKIRETIDHIHSEKKERNVPFPEINVIDVWEQVINEFSDKGKISAPQNNGLRTYSLLFELMSNRIYPMPHMKEVLLKLKSLQFPLGIISNAQFYTPIIMNYFLKNEITDKEEIEFFDPELSFYSYKLGVAKPDTTPFNQLKEQLKKNYGIKPAEAIYIGNDMYNDVYPASKTGFKTALFAGDKRSLRLRENYSIINNIQPDIVIKDLRSIFKLLDFKY